MALTKVPSNLDSITATTQSASDNSTNVATTAYVTTAVSNIVDGAPSTLNTLNEIAAALNDDAALNTTLTTSIATKLPLAGGTMTGDLTGKAVTLEPDTAGKLTIRLTTNAANDGRILLRSDTTDKVDIQANGASYFNGGNVGIGTTSPSSQFVVAASNGGNGIETQVTTHATNKQFILAYDRANSAYLNMELSALNFGIATNNGTTRLHINSSGNVGIGTSSPAVNLHVNEDASNSYGYLRLEGANRGGWIQMYDGSNAVSSILTDQSGNMNFQTASGYGGNDPSTRMLIAAGGNVGIGTTAVTSPGLWYDATNDYLAISHWSTPPTPAAMLHLSDNSNNIDVPQIRIEGRDNPGDTKLDISVKDTTARLNVIEGATDASNGYGLMEFKTNAASNASANLRGGFKFITPSDANNLVITNTGRVFIGHSSADGSSDKLGVSGSIGISTDGYIGAGSGWGPSNGAGSSSSIQLYSSATGNMTFSTNYSAADEVHNMGGASKFIIKRSAAGTEAIQLYTQDGGIRIGALNGSYHHFMRLSGPSLYYFDNPAQASGGFSTYSDERLKEEITTITGALDKVAVMNGVTFKWKDAAKRGGGDAGKQFGVLAQNMLEVDSELPKLNVDPLETQENIDDDSKDTDYYSMDYSRITPFLIEAIKELKEKLETAEARITELEG